ncbi:T9SS type A sorting domain-containing protein [Winogradskyella helgolandensis]|uniref:T9SS type A sorting domain-containing protein n=1 Tax=Winogradskyella helgolandensis TaxID=2697010 RepID=UPI0015C75074|nr:T9SS type A sorting domain-containing protein [Winogradskyella helgolandensis]
MRKILLFNALLFFINFAFGQINFEDKVNIYDYDSLSVHIIYDDFDYDGDLDIIKHGISNSGNVLLQKNENGDFNTKPSSLVSTEKSLLISLDLNNDNFPDLITYQFGSLGVMYNLQNDTFSEVEALQSNLGFYSIRPFKFDYNSDGFMDLIVVNNSNDAYVMLNDQIGGLEPVTFLMSVGSFNHIYKIDDFNNDGNSDIYIRDGNQLKIYLYDVDHDENDDSDDFVQPYILQADSSLISYGILDLDGNGFQDILYLKNGAIWAKYFDFNESLSQYTVLNDVMVVDNIPLYSNYGNDRSIHIENENNETYAVYVALETSENQQDIYKFSILDNVFSTAQIILPNFQINTFGTDQFNFLDLNNDDNLDFCFTSNFNENKMIFINNDINDPNDKTICIQQVIKPSTFSVIDMNGDGVEDICVGTQNGLGFFEKTPNNELSDLRPLIGVMSNPNASVYTINHIADINNDGLGDVIDFKNSGDYIKIYKNLGNDDFEFIQSVPLSNILLASNIAFVDINNNGYKDIVFSYTVDSPWSTSIEFHWIKNNNGINFDNPQPLIVNNVDNILPNSIAYDDFNNDNQTDILVLSSYYENNQLVNEVNLLENNNGQFNGNSIATFSGDYGRGHIKINDFDQDGDLDFFVYNINTNQYYDYNFLFFKNNGQNSFESISIENLNIEDIEFYDNDGDGINEIYAWNHDASSFTNNIFYYSTTDYINFTKVQIDSYSASYDESDPVTRGDLLLYDYNNDGKDDLFINNVSPFQGLVSVYDNISETLGIEDIENDNNLGQLQIHPNPFVNSVNWNNPKNETYNLQLFSQNGKLLLEKTTTENSLDLSAFNNGIYIFSIKEENSGYEWVYKIIKK